MPTKYPTHGIGYWSEHTGLTATEIARARDELGLRKFADGLTESQMGRICIALMSPMIDSRNGWEGLAEFRANRLQIAAKKMEAMDIELDALQESCREKIHDLADMNNRRRRWFYAAMLGIGYILAELTTAVLEALGVMQ